MENVQVGYNVLEMLKNKTILVTGATGLIGQAIIKNILRYNAELHAGIKAIAVVRNREKAEALFGMKNEKLDFIVADVCHLKPEKLGVEYVIHGASQTVSRAFVEEPVETIMTAFQGTKNLLELSRINPVKSFLYLSSMEVYGALATDEKICESHIANLDVMSVRSCYPESKRMCENLCICYASEYGIPVKIARLTQTFGRGVRYDDSRVFAEFARCVIESRDIVLHTKGETKRCYLYTEDAVAALFTILAKGNIGETYNVANSATYCSIYEMARLVAEGCGKGKIRVVINEQENCNRYGYAPILKMNLDTCKLEKLGWKPQVDLPYIFKYMIDDIKAAKIRRI